MLFSGITVMFINVSFFLLFKLGLWWHSCRSENYSIDDWNLWSDLSFPTLLCVRVCSIDSLRYSRSWSSPSLQWCTMAKHTTTWKSSTVLSKVGAPVLLPGSKRCVLCLMMTGDLFRMYLTRLVILLFLRRASRPNESRGDSLRSLQTRDRSRQNPQQARSSEKSTFM